MAIKDLQIEDRWSKGIDHEKGTVELVKLLSEIDQHHFGNYFDWRTGGDGDNGETLAYQLDELVKHGFIKIEICQNSFK